jgi:hypothetical protein
VRYSKIGATGHGSSGKISENEASTGFYRMLINKMPGGTVPLPRT